MWLPVHKKLPHNQSHVSTVSKIGAIGCAGSCRMGMNFLRCKVSKVRNDKGCLISSVTSKFFAPPLVAGAFFLREVISLTGNLNLPCVLFESDCLDLVQMCKRNAIRREIEQIVNDIQSMKMKFTSVG